MPTIPPPSNRDFLLAHAAPARIGLAGGSHPLDRAIRRAQRTLAVDAAGSAWSHAFLIGEERSDGHHGEPRLPERRTRRLREGGLAVRDHLLDGQGAEHAQ